MTASLLFACALLIPLVGVCASLFFRDQMSNVVANVLFAASGVLGLAGTLIYGATSFGSGYGVVLPGVLGSVFVATDLKVFFLALISLGVVLTSVYSVRYLEHYSEIYSLRSLNVASAVFIIAMQACVLSTSVFSFLLFWELMSVAVYFLVIADRSDASLDAGLLYFVMTHLGFVCLLAGFLVLSGGNPFLTFAQVGTTAADLSSVTLAVAFLLLFVGFGSKAGLVPFHRWLPAAHPQAPSGSSALLSGVMLKIAVFGFVQALFLFPTVPLWYGIVVCAVGLLSAFFGALYAAIESDLKRLLAWSSIENMGLIFSGIGALCIVLVLPESVHSGAIALGFLYFIVVHTVAHSIFKTGLFMAAGVVVMETHSRDMDLMGGLARTRPALSMLFLALALSATALPPFFTFYGEWSYMSALALSLRSLNVWFAVGAGVALSLLGLVAGLALFAFVKAFSAIFLGRGRTEAQEGHGTNAFFLMPIGVAAFLVLVLGIFAAPLSAILSGTSRAFLLWQAPLTLTDGASVHPLLLLVLLAICGALTYIVWLVGSSRRGVRVTDTWDCGQPLTRRMEYTSTGFAAPIRFFFRGLVVSEKKLVAVPIVPENRWIVKRTLSSSVTSFWARWLYQPIGTGVFRLAHWIKRLQNGRIQFYLLLVFGALIGVILTAL